MSEPFEQMYDIMLSYDTDIVIENGDIKYTNGIDYIEREIYKVLITDKGDWKADLNLGANLSQFIGQPNTRELGKTIEQYLYENLSMVVFPSQLQIRTVPINNSEILCLIDIYNQNMMMNRLPFQFDLINGFRKINKDINVPAISTNHYQVNDISQNSNFNKYADRIR